MNLNHSFSMNILIELTLWPVLRFSNSYICSQQISQT